MYAKHQLWPNLLAIAYSLLAYITGLMLLFSSSHYLTFIGIVLLSHGLVISAYLQHECFHRSVFRGQEHNKRLNLFLSWVNGSCYANQDDIKRMHLKHHVSKADTVNFDYRAFLNKHSNIKWLAIQLEWAYIPAVELVTHAYVMLLPFILSSHYKHRVRSLTIFGVRLLFFSLLTWFSWAALIYYAVSYCIFLTVLRIVDAFQHTFDVVPLDREHHPQTDSFKDKNYELENTYSNLISRRYPSLNLLTLNFVYHTAHHGNPSIPWYQLPRYHETSPDCINKQVIPMRKLLTNYHKFRVRRILDENYGEVHLDTQQTTGFIGAVGVSFLTDV